MLQFVIRKMFSKKWMVLSLLLGNILLISIAAGNPMYTQAVLQRTLTKNLEASLSEKNVYPGAISMQLGKSTRSPEAISEAAEQVREVADSFGVEVLHTVEYLSTMAVKGQLAFERDDADKVNLSVSTLSDMEAHIELVAGHMYSQGPDEDGVIDTIVSVSTMKQRNLLLDDVVTLERVTDPSGNPIRLRIAGVFTQNSDEDVYWMRAPLYYAEDCFIDPELFETYFLECEETCCSMDGGWYVLLDYTDMRSEAAAQILETADGWREALSGSALRYQSDNFSKILEAYLQTAKKVNVTLWVLQAPIFVLLAAFIFMVSRQMLDMERNEIAVIKSRGAGRGQIFAMYLLQSAIISMVAFAVGIPLGVYLCRVIGSANAFLEFVRRSALPVEVNATALGFAAAASVFSVCAMTLPALRYSKTGIVDHKRKKNSRRSETPLWQKMGLDVILLGVALYGLYSFNGQKELLASRVQNGASLDPLLFLSSSLFMIGAGLLAVRLTPLIVWAVYRLFRKWWSPAMYASFLRVLRTRASQSFIMVFLIMTIALGVFNAQAARTINQNAEDNIRYTVGADVALREFWPNNSAEVSADSSTPLVYKEPDFGRYEALEGAASVTKVYLDENSSVSNSLGTVKGVTLMGIHTKEFGETAWFKDSLSDIHWYHYLNAMSRNSRAVLVSRNFQTTYGAKLGDSFTYRNSNGDTQRGVVYGFVDYFPGFSPVTYEKGADGLYAETENYLVVANLQQIQSSWGVLPYWVWIRNRDSSDYLYQFAEETGAQFLQFEDADAQLVEKKNDPVLQGTNGILTVGFIVVLMLCTAGFLIYWILSIQSRSLMFGIFRAMGMSMREVFTMLLNEQICISGLSIAIGALVGSLTAKLYMPLIQLAYAASDSALPLEVISRSSDNARLFAVVGAVMLVCMMILGALISHMKIAQALKLGED